MTEVRVLIPFRTIRIQNLLFEAISYGSAWLCVAKLKEHGFETKNFRNKTKKQKIEPKIIKMSDMVSHAAWARVGSIRSHTDPYG